MSDTEYDIQTLVELSGVPRRNVYFYTQQAIIPPPSSAGLAARYTDVHLLRLRLIPVLRQQGLRLDEIRRQLDSLDLEGLRQRLAEVQQPASPPTPLPVIRKESESAGRRFIHYPLPAELTLVVPSDLKPEEQRRVSELLQAAQKILVPEGFTNL